MLSYNQSDFTYQPENKGFDYGAQIADEGSLDDLFNQYINHEPADLGNNASHSNPIESIDFPTDEDTASSGSYNNTFPDVLYTDAKQQAQYRTEADCQPAQTSGSLQPPSYRKAASTERPKPAISGLELLNLEGKLPNSSKAPTPPLSALAVTSAQTLRRKPKFSAPPPETLHDRNHRVSKSPGNLGGDPTKMMRPSYYYRHEMPSYLEWTQRFEHMSVRTPGDNPPMSPSVPEHYQNVANTEIQTQDHSFPDGTQFQNETSFMQNSNFDETTPVQQYASNQAAGFSTLPSPLTFQRPEKKARNHTKMASHHATLQGHPKELRRDKAKSQPALPQLRSTASWTQVEPIPEDFNSPLSPGQAQPSWLQDLPDSSRPYNEMSLAAQSAPTLAHSNQDFQPGTILPSEQYGQFINEDPSDNYLISPTATGFDMHSPILSPGIPQFRPQTPSSPSSSRSPSPVTPSRTRRQSKHSRRKSSVGTLKSVKSANNVFVNFTPRDREKIVNSVAPSGSSKTKARREQEASEKRRKMSLAAEKVVQEAGGDVEKLRASGVF